MSLMNLQRDLRKVGATETEAEKLADIAKIMGNIKPRNLSKETKKRLAPYPEAARQPHHLQWAMFGGSFATAALVLVIVAQSALPGSWLYGIKRGTEDARALLQPSYKDKVIENREEEVQQLKLKKADPAVLEKAEKQYQESVNDRYQQNTNKQYTPRYDWSQEWWQRRRSNNDGQTQGWRANYLER